MKRLWVQWCLTLATVAALVAPPFVYYRWQYNHAKRLRMVDPGKLYRGGQMTADGLDEAIRRFGFRTIVNFQNEMPDPLMGPDLPESEFCRQRHVKYVYIEPDLVDVWYSHKRRPAAIAEFLEVMDDPNSYPVLLHCRAGLHRTGFFTAIYRMEYQGWSLHAAVHELDANGFGRTPLSSRNEYIAQYLLSYHPRTLNGATPSAVGRTSAIDSREVR